MGVKGVKGRVFGVLVYKKAWVWEYGYVLLGEVVLYFSCPVLSCLVLPLAPCVRLSVCLSVFSVGLVLLT